MQQLDSKYKMNVLLPNDVLDFGAIFSPEDGDGIFIRNVEIYRRVYTAPKTRTSSSSSSPPWTPQIPRLLTSLS
jgi:hypothetical protein